MAASEIIKLCFPRDWKTEELYGETRFKDSTITSYGKTRSGEYVTDTVTCEAVMNFLSRINTQHVFVGKDDEDIVWIEYKKATDKNYTVARMYKSSSNKWHITACEVSSTGMASRYGTGHKGTAFILGLLDEELKSCPELAEALISMKSEVIGSEPWARACCTLSSNLYYRLEGDYDESSICPVDDKIYIFDEVSDVILSTEEYLDVNITTVLGSNEEPAIFKVTEKKTIKKSSKTKEKSSKAKKSDLKNGSEAYMLYQMNKERILTEKEETMVPKMEEWYVVPKFIEKVAKKISLSFGRKTAIKNLLWYSPAGNGKSLGGRALASMLGLPYIHQTSSVDDDKFSYLGAMLPNTEGEKSESADEILRDMGLPTFEDVAFNYEDSFEKLYGRKPTEYDDVSMVYSRLADEVAKGRKEMNEFVYIMSSLSKAIENGWFCEVQEANVPTRASVLECMNALLEDGDMAQIELPNGHVLKRHPDSIVLFTLNREYEDTNKLQQAVYSRIQLVQEFPAPSKEELILRTANKTGFKNNELLTQMVDCAVAIQEYLKENDITEGICGPRELLDWAQDAMLEAECDDRENVTEEDVIIAAKETILAKVAQNDDDVEDVTEKAFVKFFNYELVEGFK